jgi:CheY-like chemotaxis protein
MCLDDLLLSRANLWHAHLLYMDWLPSKTAARFAGARRAPATPARAEKTILLVQNSARAHNPVKAVLQERGYKIIHAESVEAALQVWAQLPIPVDLFLADLSLGKDQGVEQLVKLLQSENPRVRVLYANDLEPSPGMLITHSYPQQIATVVDSCLI